MLELKNEIFRDKALTRYTGPDIMKSLGFEPAALLDLFRSKGFAIYVIKKRGRLEPLPDGRFTVKDLDRRGYLELLASRNVQVLSKS